ncbi:biotin transport system substrate-specific component [Bacillus ectoiniformans]|uniref:biotin transporter BioY n=1 Tax=Bacillus ectoiniformans TaxID=1494429 RepID=UPI0019560E63|nr:biotin transporter BioY [Bacillus ectoiniformans]MBM7647447.1 biotin transport system substrate-specific component [Bacillus ectoiniformans]
MKTRDMTYVALFAAAMGALGLIPPIPLSFTPVPITLQTLGVLLAGGLLGARLGFISMATFLLIVAAGMPLLSGGRGGMSVFVGPSAGYLFGYPLTAMIVGYLITRIDQLSLKKVLFVNLTAGVFLLYLFGIPVQSFIMDLPLVETIKISLVYIPGDLIKATLASYLVYKLRKAPAIARQLQQAS